LPDNFHVDHQVTFDSPSFDASSRTARFTYRFVHPSVTVVGSIFIFRFTQFTPNVLIRPGKSHRRSSLVESRLEMKRMRKPARTAARFIPKSALVISVDFGLPCADPRLRPGDFHA
jgi:hypothetical protein